MENNIQILTEQDSVFEKYFSKFKDLETQYDEYTELLSSVEIMSDNKLFVHYQKLRKRLEPIIEKFKIFLKFADELDVAKELEKLEQDASLKAGLQNNIKEIEGKLLLIFEEVKKAYFETQTKEIQKVKIEITNKLDGTQFVEEFKNLILEFAKQNEFEYQIVSVTETQSTIFVEGENAFNLLRAVQGTIKKIQNTNESSILVVVLLNAEEEFDFKEEDVEIQISKSSGAGGQHINKTESAVKLIHIPTGITAECQDERSQSKNKEKAMIALKLKISQKIKENNEKYIKNQRNELKNSIFSDTPTLIFDYDRNRVSDNRTKQTYKIQEILNGNINLIASDLSI